MSSICNCESTNRAGGEPGCFEPLTDLLNGGVLIGIAGLVSKVALNSLETTGLFADAFVVLSNLSIAVGVLAGVAYLGFLVYLVITAVQKCREDQEFENMYENRRAEVLSRNVG